MSSDMEQLHELTRKVVAMADKKFGSLQSPTPANDHRINVEHEMAPYRAAYQTIIVDQIVAARNEKIDGALWSMHTRIHGKFRNALQKLANHKQQKTPIHRQTQDEYTKFIRASQRSYKTLLCALDAQYPTLARLRSIAQSIAPSNSAAGGPVSAYNATTDNIPEELKSVIITLVYETLLHLGDLSRWRYNAHLGKTSEDEWKSAALYYQLAYEVLPTSGFAKHQEAVLALGDTKYFYALSHLYHSLCSQVQHPEGSQNLDLLLRKRLNIPMNDLIQAVKTRHGGNAVATLRAWFLRLHAECYQGVEFSAHDEMEAEILNRLSNALKDGTDVSSTVFHMVMITIGGEYVAVEKAQRQIDPVKSAQVYFFLLRHNVKLFRELLLHLHDKLEGQFRENVMSSSQEPVAKLPPVAETTLYSIRLYSLWLTKNWPLLQRCMESGKPDAAMAADIRDLWNILAAVLNAIYEQYPLFDTISTGEMDYLLKEEEGTMGFMPLHGESNADVWMKDGKQKTVLRREKSLEDQEQEHLIRLRDIFTRGVIIAQDPASPFILAGDKILVNEAGTTSELFSPTPGQEHEGEPITPPPTAGGVIDMFTATAEGDQYGLWLDGSDERGGSNVPPPPPGPAGWQPAAPAVVPSVLAAQPNPPQPQQQQIQQPRAPKQAPPASRRKQDITIEQLVQKAYYPPVVAPGIQLPKQMPWVMADPVTDGIWRNDDISMVYPTQWSGHPFGQQNLYPTEREPNT